MMTLLTYVLAFLLVVDCLFLTLLILVQLPKKDAGAGMAFGGGAADALFGAGSGTALTKLTKYSAGIFFVLVIVLSLISGAGNTSNQQLRRAMESTSSQPQPAAPRATAPAATAISTSSAPALSLTSSTNALSATPAAPPATAPATNNPPK
jgi:preprotein translocase subunit SecG